jgi:hypothetical protein
VAEVESNWQTEVDSGMREEQAAHYGVSASRGSESIPVRGFEMRRDSTGRAGRR